jgi:hypothetical protein
MARPFTSRLDQPRSLDETSDFHSCKNDRNVDDDQAHKLYIAAKQHSGRNSQDLTNAKPITKMKRVSKL